jgi:hypothetical protein
MGRVAARVYQIDPIIITLQKWSTHSLRVRAYAIIHSVGMTTDQIKTTVALRRLNGLPPEYGNPR